MKLAVQTAEGTFDLDPDEEDVVGFEPGEVLPAPAPLELSLPRVLGASVSGSTVVALVDRRPPLLVSHDAGLTWHEAGGGLPKGRAIAVAPDDPDLVAYAARNRVWLSRDGGRFWRSLAFELPEIEALAFREA